MGGVGVGDSDYGYNRHLNYHRCRFCGFLERTLSRASFDENVKRQTTAVSIEV